MSRLNDFRQAAGALRGRGMPGSIAGVGARAGPRGSGSRECAVVCDLSRGATFVRFAPMCMRRWI